jgi:3-methylfumaryl-CoA hydratase
MTQSAASIDSATLAHLQAWNGKTETTQDALTLAPVNALSASLNRADALAQYGDVLPALWHWLYFLPHAQHSQVGADGHPQRGGFMPPIPLPRRMWAGSQLTWAPRNPLLLGDTLERTSTIRSVNHKAGRSGELVFVQVSHAYANAQGLALTELQDIVYRAAVAPGAAAPAPTTPPLQGQCDWRRSITPDPVLLFRYSALTFNGHRIHYDRPYATQEEGYAGLVVHGPLIATLLMDLLRRNLPEAQVLNYQFRAVRPTLDLHPFTVHGKLLDDGKTVELWGEDHEGWLTMQATATLG